MSVKLTTWKIYPTKKTWLTCIVWESVEEMRKAMLNADNPRGKVDDYRHSLAGFQCFARWNSRKESKVSGCLGTFYFAKNRCHIGTMVHEIQHFLNHWIIRMQWGKGLNKKYSEPIAEMSDDLISQFLIKYYQAFVEGGADMSTQLYSYIQATSN